MNRASGFKLLGAPIGDTNFEKEVMAQKISQTEQLIDKLNIIEDPHTEFVLLRNCLALPKISYITRTVDPRPHQELMKRFDNAVRNSMERMIGGPIDDEKWTQASLPVSMGGLGLRNAESNSLGAFVSSLCESSPIIEEILGQEKTNLPWNN